MDTTVTVYHQVVIAAKQCRTNQKRYCVAMDSAMLTEAQQSEKELDALLRNFDAFGNRIPSLCDK